MFSTLTTCSLAAAKNVFAWGTPVQADAARTHLLEGDSALVGRCVR
jgi:hypothetical protein